MDQFIPLTCDFQTLISNLRLQTSDLRLPTSNLRLQTSDLRFPTSDLRLQTSDLRLQTSDLQFPTSDLRFLISLFTILIILTNYTPSLSQSPFDPPARGFTSWLPAPNWEHGLLSGNGTMGAVVFGNPHEETIILSHSLLYLPMERSEELIAQGSRLEDIKSLIREGLYEEAAAIPVELRESSGYDDARDPFIPAFDIRITQEPANISKYIRSTDFETGEAKTIWTDDLGTFERKVFVSRADSIIVLSIKSEHPINCHIRFDRRPVNWDQWGFVGEHVGEMNAGTQDGWLTYKSSFKKLYEGGLEGYEGVGRLVLKGGSSKGNGNGIEITEAEEVMLLIKIEPSYNYEESNIPGLKKELQAVFSNYDELLGQHVDIHGSIFNRMKLELNSNDQDQNLHSEEILLKAKKNTPSPALIEKVFDAGRYNILSSTGTNPPNLQGIWSGTWTAPWSSGFTHDGNLPSAMAVVMSGNMPELMGAYSSYLKRYTDDFEYNAIKLFDARGVNLPAHTTTSGWPTDFNQTWCLSLWTGGAGWAADILYDYYRYTLDRDFLENSAYPWLKKTAWFYEDFLQEGDNGRYIFNPSYSPENNPSNTTSQAAINATMDVMLAKQVLTHALEAGEMVGENKAQLRKWREMLKKMPELEVNNEGVLREWIWPGVEDNYRHRHVSQLYSLYNGRDPDILNNPQLRAGANNLIEKKLEFRRTEDGGEMAFGLVQLGLSAAHLGEADKALEAVNWLSSRYWSTGFGSFHNVGSLLNTDISGGLPAVIIEMLVYSEKGKIHLLPSLPEEWEKGKLSGALLRNQVELKELSWEGNIVKVVLISKHKQQVKVILPAAIRKLNSRSKASVVEGEEKAILVELPANLEVVLELQL